MNLMMKRGSWAMTLLAMAPLSLSAELTTGSYVQDGLIGQFDGVDNAGTGTHDESSSVWKDLKGTIGDFTVNSSVASFTGGNALKKNASGYMAQNTVRSSAIRTIDLAISGIPSSGWVMAFFASGSQYLTFGDSSSYRSFVTDNCQTTLPKTSLKPTAATIAVTYVLSSTVLKQSQTFQNGVLLTETTGTLDNWGDSGANDMSLGARTQKSYSEKGIVGYSLHAIRLYNRALRADEAWYNNMVDAIRFRGESCPDGVRESSEGLEMRLVASAAHGGTVSVNGGTASERAEFWFTQAEGQTGLTITAVPPAGQTFAGWSGDTDKIISGSASTATITVRSVQPCHLSANCVAVWTGAGSDTKITTEGNWDVLPDLTDGSTLMSVTGGTAATLPADGTSYAFRGANVTASGFAFDAEAGAAAVSLGACGLTNSAAGTTWGWPTILGAAASTTISDRATTAQVWYTAAGKALSITGPLSGSDLYFQGSGRVDVYSTNEVPVAFVGGSNSSAPGQVNVYQQPNARLVKAGGLVDCSCMSGYGFHLMGGVHDYSIIAGTQNNGSPGAFYVEAGTTNVLKGSFKTQWANQSTMAIKGYLAVQGGLTATSIANAQGCWRPFSRTDSSCENGYLKIETNPMTANRVCIPWGTLELAAAGNLFAMRGLFIEQRGVVKTTAAGALVTGAQNKIKLSGGTLDLCGFDQGVDTFCGNGGTVTSENGAQLHVADNAYFFDSRFSNGKPASDPALNLGTNVTVCTTVFAGGAGLSKEGSLDLYLAAANTSTGTLSVANGRLILSAANSAATYPGTTIAKSQGSWAGRIDVSAGTLVVEHSAALGGTTMLYISGGTVELAEGVTLPAAAIYVADGEGGWTSLRGTCGGTESGAINQPVFPGTTTPIFTGKGKVCVGASLPGGWPTTPTEAAWTEGGADKLITTAANWNPSSASVYDGSLLATFGTGTKAVLPVNDYVFLQGLRLTQANFVLEPAANTDVFLGAQGVSNGTTGVVWNWPASLGSFNPVWYLTAGSTMELRGPLSGTGMVSIWGGGRLDVYSTNTLQGTVYVGNNNDQNANPQGEIQVYLHPGAQLAAKGATLSIGCRNGYGLHLMGNTLDCNVIVGSQNAGAGGALYVAPNTTNVINGSFATQYANQNCFKVEGLLTLRGGAECQLLSQNAQQHVHPISAESGILRIEEKPIQSHLFGIDKGRLELAAAGNVFCRQGLWLHGGRVVIDADNALSAQGTKEGNDNNCLQISSGTFDLNGHDISLDAVNGAGGTLTSDGPAQLHLPYNYLHSYSKGLVSDYVKPYLTTGLVFRTICTGGAGLAYEGSQTFYLAAVNTSTGTLSVASGRVILSTRDKTATYPGTGIDKTYGSWLAGRAEVTGGTLVLEHRNALSGEVVLATTGGQIEIPAGVSAKVGELWVDGVKLPDGIYGGEASSAENKPTNSTGAHVFAGAGLLRVGNVGFVILVASGNSSADPTAPRLKFGVLSDLHITSRGTASSTYQYGNAQTFVHALEYFRDQGVDAVVIPGDMADRGLPENLQVVANAWREVFPNNALPNGNPVERIFIYGNHDSDKSWFVNSSGQIKDSMTEEEKTALINRSISRNEAACWKDAWGEDWSPAYMKTVKGYHFIAVHWGHESEAVNLINDHCFDLHGSKPFFYIQHPLPKNTVYGSAAWGMDSGASTSALQSYPNAIAFSGHSHYPVTFEADIWQGGFTSIGSGSLSYVGHWGADCLNESAISTQQRPGFLVTVYDDHLEIKRREFVKDIDLGPDWRLDIPASSSGWPYTYAAQQTRLAAPEFPDGAVIGVETNSAGLKVTIPSAVYDVAHARVLWYALSVKQGETTILSGNVRQAGYFEAFGSIPATTAYTIPAASLPQTGTCDISLQAVDFYGRTSSALQASYSLSGK